MTNENTKRKSEPELHGRDWQRIRLRAIGSALLIGILLTVLKFYVYSFTHSSAVLADALESIINILASAFGFGSVMLAARPPDRSHPFGHGKIENFAAGLEGGLIILAAAGMCSEGISRILQPQELPHLQYGLVILFLTGVVNLFLGIGLIRVGKKTNSLTLYADGKHILTDSYTVGGVFLGLFLVHRTGLYWMDGIIACIVGMNVFAVGVKLMRKSFSGLMDACDEDLLKGISAVLRDYRREEWIDIHQLRAWHSGNFHYIDLHLALPRYLSLEQAHHEAMEIEKIIVHHFNGSASVLIHLDPCIDPDCSLCGRLPCGIRMKDQQVRVPWDWKTLSFKGRNGEHLRCMTNQKGLV
jgi:cation diffusion facilitator family transporter